MLTIWQHYKTMYLLRVKGDKGFLEARKWTGSFIQHVLFHLVKSEAGRQNHVHILPTHSFYCWIKINTLGSLAHSKHCMKMWAGENHCRKEKTKIKSKRAVMKCEIEELRKTSKQMEISILKNRRGSWYAGN